MNDTPIKIFVGFVSGMAFIILLYTCNQAGYVNANNEFYEDCLKLNAHMYFDKKITCSIE